MGNPLDLKTIYVCNTLILSTKFKSELKSNM